VYFVLIATPTSVFKRKLTRANNCPGKNANNYTQKRRCEDDL